MKNAFFLCVLLAFGAISAQSQSPAALAGTEADWFFHYDKALAFEAKTKHDKACTSLRKAAGLAIESLNESIMLKRLLADQEGALRYLAFGPNNLEWDRIRKALETRDAMWLQKSHPNTFDSHGGHNH